MDESCYKLYANQGSPSVFQTAVVAGFSSEVSKVVDSELRYTVQLTLRQAELLMLASKVMVDQSLDVVGDHDLDELEVSLTAAFLALARSTKGAVSHLRWMLLTSPEGVGLEEYL